MKKFSLFLFVVILSMTIITTAYAIEEPTLYEDMEQVQAIEPAPIPPCEDIFDEFIVMKEILPSDNPLVFIPDLKLQDAIRDALDMGSKDPIEYVHLLMLGGMWDISGLGITSLGGLEYADNLSGLIADDNEISDVPNGMDLKYLSLNNNAFTEIPESVYNIPRLCMISMDNNNISSIDSRLFSDSMRHISLNGNIIKEIPDALSTAIKMIWLDLGNCYITNLPDIAGLTDLTMLDISKSRLDEYPAYIDDMELVSLNIAGCGYDIDGIVPNSTMEYLDISGNNVSGTLPESIVNLENLKYLNISSMKLDVLPEQSVWQYSIEYLDVSDNRLVILPDTLHGVRTLIINRNLITELPRMTGKYLDVRYNYLSQLPTFYGQLMLTDYNDINGAENSLIRPSSVSIKVVDGIISLNFSSQKESYDNVSLLGYNVVIDDVIVDVLPSDANSWQGGSVLPGDFKRVRIDAINIIDDDDFNKYKMYTSKYCVASLPSTPSPEPTAEPTPIPTIEPDPIIEDEDGLPWMWILIPVALIFGLLIRISIIRSKK